MNAFRQGFRSIASLLAILGPPLSIHAQEERCGAGKDLVVQALERAGPQSSANEFADALQLLKRAVAECPSLGDAWYYRSLVEAHLGHAPLAKFAADQAKLVGSEALDENLQPFILATPPGQRGLTVEHDTSQPPSAISGTPTVPGSAPTKWALVVGIGNFADQGIKALRYTTADATAFAALLTDPAVGRFPKANVHVLTDTAATTKGIKSELNWIARHAGPDDIVVIYVATHGSPRSLDTAGGLNYLLTYDTQIRREGEFDQDSLYATAFPMVELSSAVATRMRALRTLVVLDTCFSGGSVGNGDLLIAPGLANASAAPEALKRMSEGSGRIVLAASRVDQESFESDTLKHGYFTYFLLQDLRQSKGMQAISQVFANVHQQVSDRVNIDFGHGTLHQDPVMARSSNEADFALVAE
jgi:hypothetical protein